jgi:hypothetical protein
LALYKIITVYDALIKTKVSFTLYTMLMLGYQQASQSWFKGLVRVNAFYPIETSSKHLSVLRFNFETFTASKEFS